MYLAPETIERRKVVDKSNRYTDKVLASSYRLMPESDTS